MPKKDAWECSCGHIVYEDESPDQCPSCNKVDSFVQLPEELRTERENSFLNDSFQEELLEEKLEEDLVPMKFPAREKTAKSIKLKKAPAAKKQKKPAKKVRKPKR